MLEMPGDMLVSADCVKKSLNLLARVESTWENTFMRIMIIILRAACLLLVVALAPSLTVQATGVNLNPTSDAFVTTGPPTNNLAANNYGGGGALAVSAAGLSKGEFQSVLRFDTSSAKSSFDGLYGAGLWSLQSVTLQLTAGSPNNSIFNANSAGSFGVSWLQNDGWTEGTGTPNAPTTAGITFSSLQTVFVNPSADEALGTFSHDGSSSGTSVYTMNMTLGFASDILAGGLVSLRLSSADSAVSYFFDSRSFGNAGSRPLLSINAVPEPGATTLLALGGLLCALRGVTKRRN